MPRTTGSTGMTGGKAQSRSEHGLDFRLLASRTEGINFCGLTQFVPLLFFVFCLFMAAPVACGGSQARGRIGAVAAGLPHSHSRSLT